MDVRRVRFNKNGGERDLTDGLLQDLGLRIVLQELSANADGKAKPDIDLAVGRGKLFVHEGILKGLRDKKQELL